MFGKQVCCCNAYSVATAHFCFVKVNVYRKNQVYAKIGFVL